VADQSFYPPIPLRAKKKIIQDAAERYAELLRLKPGFVIEDLVTRLGGHIEFREAMGASPDSESILVFSGQRFTIFLATNTHPLRDRFTIAHELGHFLIHYPVVVDKHGTGVGMRATRFVDENNPELVRTEWEANWFAAALLMPERRFKEEWHIHRDVSRMANIFGVTKNAAEVRARSLELLIAS